MDSDMIGFGCLGASVVALAFAFVMFFSFFGAGQDAKNSSGQNSGGTPSTVAVGCGNPMKPEDPPALACGFTSRAPSPNGFYIPTNFGCNIGFPKDPSDNCQQACPAVDSVLKQSGTVKTDKSSGPAYESSVEWYSANADEYGCNKNLKVTNPYTGQAVIVKAIDRGPSCSVMRKGAKFDMSQAAEKAIGNPNRAKVEPVADNTPLGPIPACSLRSTSPGSTVSPSTP